MGCVTPYKSKLARLTLAYSPSSTNSLSVTIRYPLPVKNSSWIFFFHPRLQIRQWFPAKIILNTFVRTFTLCRYAKILQGIDYFLEIVKGILQERRTKGFTGSKDLVHLMLKAHEEHVDGVSKLSENEIMAQSIVFLVAGFETTGNKKSSYSIKCILNSSIVGVCHAFWIQISLFLLAAFLFLCP